MTDRETTAPFSILIRIAVWLGFAAMLYLLRSFFLLIFLTFVFAYIQNNGVNRLKRFVPSRTSRVILVALIFLGVLISLGYLIAPRVVEQTKLFVSRYPTYIERLDEEILALSVQYPIIADLMPQDLQTDSGVYSPTAEIVQQVLGVDHGKGADAVKKTLATVKAVGTSALGLSSAFLLALLFSFLIVLDLPSLAEGVRSLRHTRIRFIYDEVVGSMLEFGNVLGRALEAQLFIALLNTVLTAIGLYILGITEKTAFLSLIVFICSFIPVAGVFISSVPICLLALQQSGFQLMFGAIVMITVVHLLEAYVLNPKIYGHHMRINPVIVLIILTISGKLFHVWGLILGVPVCTYIFAHAIRYKEDAVDSS
jgi:predicted PurR-regulated permease PerM